MDVEVDDGDALGAMVRPGVVGCDRGGVEQAEAHGLVALGMVAGRAGGAEHVVELAFITASTPRMAAPTQA
jgi:hypothetical protein